MNYFKKWCVLSSIVLLILGCEPNVIYDVVILNGAVFEGSQEAQIRQLDIGIIDDQIVTLGTLSNPKAKRIIDATGRVVSPGFIDLHAHLEPIFELSDCESHIRQGVTTSLGGPDGRGPLPFGHYLDSLSQLGVGMNVGFLAGHNAIRSKVMQLNNREPTVDELQEMKDLVAQAMDEGAFGLSTGLKYLPGNFSKVDEVIALSKEASQRGGIYTSHLRDEGLSLLASVAEAVEIAEKASIPVVLTHHKVIGKPMWGKSDQTLAMVDEARSRGLNVVMDQYPYNASYTGISSFEFIPIKLT